MAIKKANTVVRRVQRNQIDRVSEIIELINRNAEPTFHNSTIGGGLRNRLQNCRGMVGAGQNRFHARTLDNAQSREPIRFSKL